MHETEKPSEIDSQMVSAVLVQPEMERGRFPLVSNSPFGQGHCSPTCLLVSTPGLPVILPHWATANRERQGALTESRTTIAGDPFYREWLCGACQGCRGRILERLYKSNTRKDAMSRHLTWATEGFDCAGFILVSFQIS
jgi:hypothetical protein